jgi:RNA polymerase sigma factor (sigma-70 family)
MSRYESLDDGALFALDWRTDDAITTEFCKRFQPWLVSYFILATRDPVAAKECADDTVAKVSAAMRKRTSFKEFSNGARGYVSKAAKSVLRDRQRRMSRDSRRSQYPTARTAQDLVPFELGDDDLPDTVQFDVFRERYGLSGVSEFTVRSAIGGGGALDAISEQRHHEVLNALIALLPPAARTVAILMREGKSTVEIAQMLGKSQAAVRQLWQTARARAEERRDELLTSTTENLRSG